MVSVRFAWNDVSRVAIFGFVNPLFSVILSALVLGEVRQAFNMEVSSHCFLSVWEFMW